MRIAAVITFLVVSTANIHAFNNLIPRNKEVIYSWKADVKAGTYLPDSYASQLVLEAKLHLQADDSSIFVKITNLTQRTYNGVFDFVHELETRELPVADEAQDLGSVFRILYKDGLVKEISTQKEEKEFSRNIKKAIASTLQLNNTIVSEEHDGTFSVQEKSIHGYDQTVYDVFTLNGNKTEIWKLRNSDDSSTVKSPCYATKERNLQQDNLKKYFLEKEDDKFVVKRITTSNSIVHHPFKAKSVAQMILVNQTFDLNEIVPIEEQYKVESEHFEESLTYHQFNNLEDDFILDVTNDRLTTVKKLLQDVHKYLHEDHIKIDEADIKRGQLIDRLQKILTHFSYKKLEELQDTLGNAKLEIFYQILPLVGTEASALYVQTLIKKKLVDKSTAINLLQHLPETIKPSIKLLTQLEDLLHVKKSSNVRKVAILTFGSLIHKAYKHYQETSNDKDLEKLFQKYVKHYIDGAKNSSYPKRMSYLLGLQNMNLPMVAPSLLPAIKGEWSDNRHIRFTALKAVGPALLYQSSTDVVETFWPLFANRREFTEIRILSYFYIMRSNPSLSIIRNIHQFALEDPDEELYQYHYDFSQNQELKPKLSEIIKFGPKPKGQSTVNVFRYNEPHYGYGGGIKYNLYNTNISRIYSLAKFSRRGPTDEEDYELFFKFVAKHRGHSLFSDLAKFIHYYSRDLKENFLAELILSKSGRVTDFYFIHDNNSEERLSFLTFLYNVASATTGSLSKDLLHVYYQKHQTSVIPTDLGIPAIFENVMPDLYHLNASIEKRIVNDEFTINFGAKYSNWVHYSTSLNFYNPISDIWHGVDKRQYYDVSIPLHFTLTVNLRRNSIKFFWKKHEDAVWNAAGIRSFSEQTIFIKGNTSERVKRVGSEKLAQNTLFDCGFADLGYKISAGVQSDLKLSTSVIKKFLTSFMKPEGTYFDSVESLLILMWLNFQDTLVLFPLAGTHAFIFKTEPSIEHPATSLEFFSNLYAESVDKKGHFQLNITVRNRQEIVRSWEGKATVYSEHNNQFLKVRLTSGSGYKISLDSVIPKKENDLQLKIVLGQSRLVTIDLKAAWEKSLEQKNSKYLTCPNQFNGEKYCQVNDMPRHKTIEVKSENVPDGLKSIVVLLWDEFRNYYHSYYTREFQPNENITADSFKYSVTYLLNSDDVNTDVATNQELHRFSTVPNNLWFEDFRQSYVHFDHCIVYHDHYYFNDQLVSKEVPTDWTPFVKSRFSDGISLKPVSNKMAVNITSFPPLEIEPVEDSFIVRYNGTEIGSEEYQDIGIKFKKITDGGEVLVAYLPKISTYLEYYVDRVVIALPQQSKFLNGRCYSR